MEFDLLNFKTPNEIQLEIAKNIGLNYDKTKKNAEEMREIIKEDLGKIIKSQK